MTYKRCTIFDLLISSISRCLFGKRPDIAVGDLVALRSPYSYEEEICKVVSTSPYTAVGVGTTDEIPFERGDIVQHWRMP